MKFSMTGQEIGDLLIEVNTWAGLYCILLIHHTVLSPLFLAISRSYCILLIHHTVLSPLFLPLSSSNCNYVTQLITSMSVRIRSTKNILLLKFTL